MKTLKILDRLLRKPGVYGIRCVVNNKLYVGSSINMRGRCYTHLNHLRRGVHDNSYLQRAWIKHGENNFEFVVLKRCKAGRILIYEQCYLDKTEACDRRYGYNICLFAEGGAMLGRNHSLVARTRMSKTRAGIIPVAATLAAAIANRGKHRSDEIKAKISKGHKGKKLSEDHRANIKATHWTKGENAAEIAKRCLSKNWEVGRKMSPESSKKKSDAMRKIWEKRRAAKSQLKKDSQSQIHDLVENLQAKFRRRLSVSLTM